MLFVLFVSEEGTGCSQVHQKEPSQCYIYSLIESAKANALEPYKYLRYFFEKLPFAKTAEDYKKILPASLDQQQLENAPKVSLV